MASCADDDETCSYGCLAIEYLYWTLQSLLGYQDGDNAPPGRCEQIADEWQLCNAELMEALDPVMTAVLRTPDLRMASVMPDGTYEPALLTLKGDKQQRNECPRAQKKNVVYPPRRRICLTEPIPFPFLLADWQQMGCLMDATEKICEGDGTEELLEPYGTESLYM